MAALCRLWYQREQPNFESLFTDSSKIQSTVWWCQHFGHVTKGILIKIIYLHSTVNSSDKLTSWCNQDVFSITGFHIVKTNFKTSSGLQNIQLGESGGRILGLRLLHFKLQHLQWTKNTKQLLASLAACINSVTQFSLRLSEPITLEGYF